MSSYSTFTNDLQAQRLAALQATADEYNEDKDNSTSAVRRISVVATSVSKGCSNAFRFFTNQIKAIL